MEQARVARRDSIADEMSQHAGAERRAAAGA